MPKANLREYWNAVAHQINNANANIMLETSTLQLLLKKMEGPKEPILKVLNSLDLSVEVVSAALREMEEIWQKVEKGESLDLKTWEQDFRRRTIQLKEKGSPDNP